MPSNDTEVAVIPPLALRLRSAWAPDRTSYLLTLPVAALAILFSTEPLGGGAWPERVAITMICLVSGIPWIALTSRIHRRWPQLPLALAIAYLLLSGAALGLSIEFLERLWSLTEPTDAALRALLTAVLLTWWFLTLGLLLDGRRRILQQRRDLIDERVRLIQASEEHGDLISGLRHQIASDLSARLEPAVRTIDARLRDQQDALVYERGEEVACILHDAAHETLRPMSRRIWAVTDDAYRPPSVFGLIRRIVSENPFRPVIVSLIFAVTAAAGQRGETASGLISIGVAILAIVIIMSGANLLMRMVPRHHSAIFIATVIVLQFPVLLGVWFDAFRTVPSVTVLDALAQVLLGVIIILLTSGFGTWRRSHLQILAMMREDLDRDEVAGAARQRVTVQILRDLARHLHGELQSQIFVAASQIERAAAEEDPGSVIDALRRARGALVNPLNMSPSVTGGQPTVVFPPKETGSPADELREDLDHLRELWAGLLTIDYTIEGDGMIDADHARAISAIVEESAANAVRHGNADRLFISVSRGHEGGEWIVDVTDDGDGLATGSPGLGSEIIDQFASTWSREDRGEQGTTLRAIIT